MESRYRTRIRLSISRAVLDSRLLWIPHTTYIAGKVQRAVSVVRVLSRLSWGANPNLLLSVNRGLVSRFWGHLYWSGFLRSILGQQIWRSAHGLHLGSLSRAVFYFFVLKFILV